MIGQSTLLRSYLRGISRLSGGGTVSLFVPSPWSVSTRTLLIHEGPWDPLPEVADLAAAFEFQRRVEQQDDWTFPTENEIASPQELMGRVIPSRDGQGILIPVPTLYHALADVDRDRTGDGGEAEGGGREDAGAGPGLPDGPEDSEVVVLPRRRWTDGMLDPDACLPVAWLALRYEPGSESLTAPEVQLPTPQIDPARWLVWILALGGAIASHEVHISAVLSDPVSGLPGRAEFQQSLLDVLERAEVSQRPATLAMLNPDRFGDINDHFGREAGDDVIQQIAARLRTNLRNSDLVARYGGVIFAVVFPDTSRAVSRFVAEKLLEIMQEEAYLDGAVRIGFSAGIAVHEPAEGDPLDSLELIRCADHALHMAKRSGGGKVVLWDDQPEAEVIGTLDRLSGIFTGNLGNDYRNMVLLWETVSIIAGSPDFATLAGEVVRRLYTAFHPGRVAIFAYDETQGPRLLEGLSHDQPASSSAPAVLGLGAAERRMVEDACREGQMWTSWIDAHVSHVELAHPAVAIPLTTQDGCIGCLYLDGPDGNFELASSDLTFLKALAGQLAVALDRARLAEQERVRRERQERRLRDELNELRQAFRKSKLLHASSKMDEILQTVRRVAPTDATVLLIGESGTGKGVVSRAIHRYSPRRDKPLVEVDCGAIATTLIDSELFGREAGAYTGAGQRSRGRLAEADGGTVLLDEVGELPLEVQSKLLRFVQERQIISVGATRSRTVDVRVLAATNRDLAAEVEAGRFRRDLYYRLNVVQIHVPPLRERREDILLLARHFVEQFAMQYQKEVHGLSFEAERALLGHGWPGNVRELQNRMMRAVILCEDDTVGADELGLAAGDAIVDFGDVEAAVEEPAASEPELPLLPPAAPLPPPATSVPPPVDATAPSGPAIPDFPAPAGAAPAAGGDPVTLLRQALSSRVEAACRGDGTPVPFGKWLHDDLVLEAWRAADGVGRRAAAYLGIAESTFRRKSKQVLAMEEAGLRVRPEGWRELRTWIAAWVRQDSGRTADLLDEARRLLLAEVHPRFPDDAVRGAALMGCTPPTYRRWQKAVVG